METHPKLRRVPSMFGTSFASCSSRTISDVINKAVAVPLPRPFPSICRPSTASTDTYLPEPTAPVTIADILKGRFCPSAAPPSTPPRHLLHQNTQKRQSTKKVILATSVCSFSSDDDERETEYEVDEEEEDETDTLFSSGSFSSDSSAGIFSRRRRTVSQPRVDMKDSLAVVKKSSDPYGDFRRSMVEMIVEKEMFAAEDLERLLQCFLSLNSPHHHGVIVEVFTEIWEAMFPH